MLTEDERYIYEERLGLLGVIDWKPTETEHQLALEDVERFNREMQQDQT